jgi:hypothetical protein
MMSASIGCGVATGDVVVARIQEAIGIRSVLEAAVLGFVESIPHIDVLVVPFDDELGVVEVVVDDLGAGPGAVFVEEG